MPWPTGQHEVLISENQTRLVRQDNPNILYNSTQVDINANQVTEVHADLPVQEVNDVTFSGTDS
jgi:hypothetical protein